MTHVVKPNKCDEVLKEDHEEKTRNEFLAPVEVSESTQNDDVSSEHKRNNVVLACFSESG